MDLPVEISVGPWLARRRRAGDGAAIAEAMTRSLAELAPWFPTAAADAERQSWDPDQADADALARSASGVQHDWVLLGEEGVMGMAFLMEKIERGVVLGYWVRSDCTGRGLASATAQALARTALAVDGVDVVEARCDEANVRSARALAAAGFVLAVVVPHSIDAPGQTGQSQVWRCTKADLPVRHGYTNLTVVRGDEVHKRYSGHDGPERLDREHAALLALRGHLPVAPVLAVEDRLLVLARVDGRHGQALVDEGHAGAVLHALGRLLREVQSVAPSWMPGWDGRGVLVHGDFGVNNVLFDPVTFEPTLVVDWERCTIGGPVLDLAWAECIIRLHHPDAVDAIPALFDGYGDRPSWPERQAAMLAQATALEAWVSARWNGARAVGWRRRSEAIATWSDVR
jgi:RimJ/RimL family protein N-acetyltransferase